MECSRCATRNEPGSKFCRECGERLALSCPSCAGPVGADDKFCNACGMLLSGGTTVSSRPTAAPATDGGSSGDLTERRLVSVLFVDLVGFTSYSEGRDAEDVRGMLSRYFDAATDAVTRHGGSVEKFIGDAVMAVWGTPVAHEDDAERAVRSALEIVDRVEALGVHLGVPLAARAGVLTGEAVALLDAVDQGFVTGDLVNTASRLQSAADPGTVLVGERTYRATSTAIAYDAIDPLTLKGKSDQVAAWRALRVLGERGGSNRGSAPEPPFLGRDEQLRMLKELLHSTGREGRPRLVHLNGVAGIGKSRLVWELLKYIDGLTEDIFWHHGRCPSYGEGITFWAFAEMVRLRATIAETDDDDTQRTKLRATLQEYVTDADERAWLEPHLGHLLGLEPGEPGSRDELFGAWRRFIERVADHGTVVLVVEDLQWADNGLMDFLESILEWSRAHPILVLSMARPELADRRATWGVGVRNMITVHLDRLADDDIRALVTGYVSGLPEDGLDRLVGRAEGVPMYAVETVRMLADRGVLEQVGEAYRVVGELGAELDIPETLHALVAARLDGLPDAERALVQDAAVAGHSFTAEAAAAVSGRAAEDIEPLLRMLVRKEVLDQNQDPRSPERGQYRFVQSVIREVAYSTLSKAARRTKHLAVARRLEDLDDDELAAVLATHYLEAYRADPGADDAEDIADRARASLERAGDRALALGSPEQAGSYAEQALSLAARPEDRARALFAQLRAATLYAGAEQLWPITQDALAASAATGDSIGEARVLLEAGRVLFDPTTDMASVFEALAEDVLSRLPEDNVSERALLLSRLALGADRTGRRGRSLELSERAIVLAQRVDDAHVLSTAAEARAWALNSHGRTFESGLIFDAIVDLARRAGRPSDLAGALTTRSMLLWSVDHHMAIELAKESAGICREIGDLGTLAINLGNLIEGYLDLGEWDLAEELLSEARLREPLGTANADALDLNEAQLLAQRGQFVPARELLSSVAERRGDVTRHLHLRTWLLKTLALAKLLEGDSAGALRDVEESLTSDPNGSNAGAGLWVGVAAACSLRDADAIRTLLTLTSGSPGRWLDAVRTTARAAIAAVDSAPQAEADMLESLQVWRDLDLALDHAYAVLCAAWTLGVDRVPAADTRRARTFLERGRAVALLALFDNAGLIDS